MPGTLYIPYLLVLLIVPVLVQWRRGLVASVIVVVVELGLVALIFYLLNAYRVLPDPFAGEPRPQAPMEIMRRAGREQAVGFVELAFFVMVPALAALIGGGFAVLWSVAVVVSRMVFQRTNSQ
jgi:hypothetical protein